MKLTLDNLFEYDKENELMKIKSKIEMHMIMEK